MKSSIPHGKQGVPLGVPDAKNAPLSTLLQWFLQEGFPGLLLEQREGMLVLKLPSLGHRHRLLADPDLRQRLIAQMKPLGFTHIALELTAESI